MSLAACGGDGDSGGEVNRKPDFIQGAITEKAYDGATDDLLTAGLGKTGLGGAAPAFAVPAAPTAAELRRNAIYNNYRALVDYTAAGGYGLLYGPNVDKDGMLEGLDLEEVAWIASIVRGRFIISGGVGSLADLEGLVKLRQVNLSGVIAGKALYEHRFTVAEALKVLDAAKPKPVKGAKKK